MFGEIGKFNVVDGFINEIKEIAKKLEDLTTEEKTDKVIREELLTKDEAVFLAKEKFKILQARNEAYADRLVAEAHELEKLAMQFRTGRKGKPKEVTVEEEGPLRMLVNKIQSGKAEAQNQVKVIEEIVEPEIKRVQEMITALEAMKKLVQDKLEGRDHEKIKTLEEEIEQEIEELKDELASYYEKAMLLTHGQRKAAVTTINKLVKNDFESRAQVNTLKILYDIGAKLKITPKEVHDEVLAGFELNQMKNDFFDGLSEFIMKPKESLAKGVDTIRTSLKGQEKKNS